MSTRESQRVPPKRRPFGDVGVVVDFSAVAADAGGTPDAAFIGLDRRKTSILATVVYEYIATGEPVGSAMLTQKYNLGVSPATVRAEMADLEEEGYLDQPHTSAGRVPSDLGYRYYVDRLMLPETVTQEERDRIKTEVGRASRQLDSAADHASHVLSNLTKHIAFAIAPRLDGQSYRHVQLIWIDVRSVHVVLVTNVGVAAQTTVETSEDVDPDRLTRACNNLNRHLVGHRLSDITFEKLNQLSAETPLPSDLVRLLAGLFIEQSEAHVERRLFAGGAHNLLDQQEFRDLRKLRAILDLLEEQRSLYELLQESLSTKGPKVSIGHELGNADMSECSVVTMPYKVANRNAGAVGVLGPRRMQYAKLIALVTYMTERLNVLFQGEFFES
ncbi:MAG: heat-inducible transcription repressor HrcA [Candidatus Eremiobacteraeota bacterium]|nr:heat-inducible transcription repressor HrcA [Candidatus Eremiobacteraeota bacterium]MBC5827333.1 heat-inducible transcription repressor HrcA [Candidatus Eremiobacteraeota bacterium]